MGLEVASYINQLIANNPVGGVDFYSTADDHLRLVKSVLLASFPSVGGAVTATHIELNFVAGATSNIQTQLTGKEATANKNVANGYAGLNAAVQLDNLQIAVTGVTQHQASLSIAASQISSGVINTARLGAGSAGGVTFLRGDSLWAQIDFSQLSGTSSVVQTPAATAATPNTLALRDSSGDLTTRLLISTLAVDDSNVVGQVCYRISDASPHDRHCTLTRLKRQVTLNCTIAADPGGTPSGSPGDVFFYY